MRYSKWYSNQDKKLVLLIIIKEIKDQFRLPRPTNSQRQGPPSAGFVASEDRDFPDPRDWTGVLRRNYALSHRQ